MHSSHPEEILPEMLIVNDPMIMTPPE